MAAAAFAYPLMLAFPATYLAVGGWRALRRARAAGRRADWRAALRGPRRLAWAAGAVGALAVCAVLIRGVGEKTISAAAALSPWGDLSGWSGSALPYLPFPRFLGLPDGGGWAWLAVAAIALAAAWGLARAPRATAVPLGATVLGALAFALYFRLRAQAQLFYFKDLGFAGPLLVTLAVVGAGDLIGRARARAPAPGRSRWVAGLAAAGLAAVAVTSFVATRRDVAGTFEQASTGVLALRDWSARLPARASVRIDVPPSGWQLWADYMLARHRECALTPLVGFFPYAVPGRKADYVVTYATQPRPADATGGALFANSQFRLYRMSAGVPGPDVCSRRMVDVSKVGLT